MIFSPNVALRHNSTVRFGAGSPGPLHLSDLHSEDSSDISMGVDSSESSPMNALGTERFTRREPEANYQEALSPLGGGAAVSRQEELPQQQWLPQAYPLDNPHFNFSPIAQVWQVFYPTGSQRNDEGDIEMGYFASQQHPIEPPPRYEDAVQNTQQTETLGQAAKRHWKALATLALLLTGGSAGTTYGITKAVMDTNQPQATPIPDNPFVPSPTPSTGLPHFPTFPPFPTSIPPIGIPGGIGGGGSAGNAGQAGNSGNAGQTVDNGNIGTANSPGNHSQADGSQGNALNGGAANDVDQLAGHGHNRTTSPHDSQEPLDGHLP